MGEAPAGREEAAWFQIVRMPPLLDELDPKIPRYVAKVIHRMILKQAEERFSNMKDVEDALSAVLKRYEAEFGRDGPAATDLSRPSPLRGVPAPRDTLRAVQVMTNQVTVKAPHVNSGDTEQISKLPLSVPEPKPAPPAAAPTIKRTASKSEPAPARRSSLVPPSSDKPTIWVAPADTARGAPVPAATSEGPATASVRSKSAVPPSTAPPVASRIPAPPLTKAQAPLLKDRSVRTAAKWAVVVGLLGGTANGLHSIDASSPAADAAPRAAAMGSVSPPTAPEVAPAAQPQREAAAATPPAPNAPPIPPRPAAIPPVAPRVAAISAASARPTPKASTAKAANPLKPSDFELKERMDWLDGDPQPKPKPAPAPKSSPRGREMIF